MAHMYFQLPVLEKFVGDAFQAFGFTKDESAIITDVLLTADMYGIESHGMQRLSRYDNGLKSGLIKLDANPEVVFETPISAVIEGHDGMGQLIGHKAMEIAIEKAKKTGIGIVSVRNSNHYGIAGYYALMAVKEGLVGLSTTNSEAIISSSMPPPRSSPAASSRCTARLRKSCRTAGRSTSTATPPRTRKTF